MIKVKISRNYSFPNLFRQTPNESAIWDNIQFTEDHVTEADFVVILNQPATDIKIKSTKGGTWLFLQEPPYTRNDHFKYHFRFVDKVISGFSNEDPKNENASAGLPWHINKNYDELVKLKSTDLQKSNRVSWITSNINLFPGHQPRLTFIDFLKKKNFDFDLFGRGFEPINDKFDGIAPYKYSIAVENYIAKDYWTEKAIDCYLSWTMPIYYGCSNFEDYFPEKSFIRIDIRNPEEALQIMKSAVENKLWEQNIDAIEESRNLILNKYQMFPMIAHRIREFQEIYPLAGKRTYDIPASGLTKTEEVKKKIRNFFKRQ